MKPKPWETGKPKSPAKEPPKKPKKPPKSDEPPVPWEFQDRRGRPTKYKASFAKAAAKMGELGATDQDIADGLGVACGTLYLWKAKYPEFAEAIRVGKDHADERVKSALYHAAVGYSCDEDEVKTVGKRVLTTTVRKQYPPNVKAAAIWLYNRKPEEFKMHGPLAGANAEDLVDAFSKLADKLPD